jgi:hypothetical protein
VVAVDIANNLIKMEVLAKEAGLQVMVLLILLAVLEHLHKVIQVVRVGVAVVLLVAAVAQAEQVVTIEILAEEAMVVSVFFHL